jgi:hypothetical protein
MQILWLAIFLYSIGLGVVLQFRPALMFHANGAWKEFGYQRDARYTIFPFWLFAITWALVSYALAAAIVAMWGRGAAVASTAAAATSWSSLSSSGRTRPIVYEEPSEEEIMEETEVEDEEEAPMEEIAVPVSRVTAKRGRPRGSTSTNGKGKPRPGYYVLDPAQTSEAGLRRYIYYGPDRPTEA